MGGSSSHPPSEDKQDWASAVPACHRLHLILHVRPNHSPAFQAGLHRDTATYASSAAGPTARVWGQETSSFGGPGGLSPERFPSRFRLSCRGSVHSFYPGPYPSLCLSFLANRMARRAESSATRHPSVPSNTDGLGWGSQTQGKVSAFSEWMG